MASQRALTQTSMLGPFTKSFDLKLAYHLPRENEADRESQIYWNWLEYDTYNVEIHAMRAGL